MNLSNDKHRPSEIVRAATQVFVKHGLTPLSYELIANEAGTSQQTIRRYYPDPQDLALDLCHQLSVWFDEDLQKSLRPMRKAERLEQLLNFYLDLPSRLIQPNRRDDQIINALVALSAKSEDIQEELRMHYLSMQERIAKAIKGAHADIKPKQCSVLGFQIVCLIYGHWKMVSSLGFPADRNRVTRAAIDRLIAAQAASAI